MKIIKKAVFYIKINMYICSIIIKTMKQLRLNHSKKQTMQISNDAFMYLFKGEEPLDEENLEEAYEIIALFPDGFSIEKDWKAVEDSDLIECTLVPFIEQECDFDEYENLTNNLQMQIKWLNGDCIRAWLYNLQTGVRELKGDFNVYTNNFGHKCFHTGSQDLQFITGKMSLYFLKNFKKKTAKA